MQLRFKEIGSVTFGIVPAVLAYGFSLYDPQSFYFSLFSRCGALMILAGANLEILYFRRELEKNLLGRAQLLSGLVALGRVVTEIESFQRKLYHSMQHILNFLETDEKTHLDFDSLPDAQKLPDIDVPEPLYTDVDTQFSEVGKWMIISGTVIWAFGDWIAELGSTSSLSAW